MILVTRLDGREIAVNSDLVATVERTPDTMLTLSNGGRILVREALEEVVERVVAFRRRIAAAQREG
ncbi:flagellar FlbD family protein [Vulgatibacter sp.]|uniref:flagellar FlbD family protein n=1 Tax=Vulgatibacter sp. TaxID=1971226 RepID=UPI003564C748